MSDSLARNEGHPLDLSWVSKCNINLPSINRRADNLAINQSVKSKWQAAWLLRAVTCIDLTTLAGDDTSCNVARLCHKAENPLSSELLQLLELKDKDLIKCGAVCVYPAQVSCAVNEINRFKSTVNVASVATGFPSGQYHLKTKLEEIRLCVNDGATEIDIVISRELALNGKWTELYNELKQMREACGKAHMKSILAVGELGSLTNVYKASLIAMMAGSDFIKTSTGKEAVNATIPVGIVMCRAIRDFHEKTGYMVGFKPAGGIRTAKDAILWLILIKEELGNEWLNNRYFRIGASGLLLDIERQLYFYVHGRYPAARQFAMV